MSSVRRVGHVVGSVNGYMTLLVESLKERGVESQVFAAGSSDGDLAEPSNRIAQEIRDAGLQIVFFHTGPSDDFAARVASLRAAPIQVNVNHGSEIDGDVCDGFIHLTQNAMARSRFSSLPSVWIPPSSDIEKELQSSTFQTRESLGLEAASSVSATLSTPPRDRNIGFIRIIIELLKRHPEQFHFLGGISDVRAIRGLLHSEGVLPRIRFLGQNSQASPLLAVVDVYLAAFPDSNGNGVLEMMAAGKPVVALRQGQDSEFNTAAELVGEKELTPATPAEYLDLADRVIRDTEARSRLGDAMQKRFFMEFTPSRMADRYMDFVARLVK